MNNEQLRTALSALPTPDLIEKRTPDNSPGSQEFYQARTVARLLEAARNEVLRKNALALWDSLLEHEKSGDCASSLRVELLMGHFGDDIRATRFGMDT